MSFWREKLEVNLLADQMPVDRYRFTQLRARSGLRWACETRGARSYGGAWDDGEDDTTEEEKGSKEGVDLKQHGERWTSRRGKSQGTQRHGNLLGGVLFFWFICQKVTYYSINRCLFEERSCFVFSAPGDKIINLEVYIQCSMLMV